MWESRSDFQGGCETRRVLHSTVISTALSAAQFAVFSSSPARWPQLLEEFAFGLLHALGGFGIADRGGDALQNGDGESRAQVLGGLGQGQQGLQRGLIAPVVAPLTAFLVDFDIGLGAGAMVVQIGIEVRAVEVLDGFGMFGVRCSRSPCACGSPRHSWFPPARYRCCAGAGFWFARSAACSADGPRSG